MTENEIAYQIVGASLELHREVGSGLLESAYEFAFAFELREHGLKVKQQCEMPFHYKNNMMEVGYRIDLPVEVKAIVELKNVETIHPVNFAQTIT
jgi:GxxExxY protein